MRAEGFPNTVLVVDDDPDFLDRLSCELGRISGLKVEAVNTAREAVQRMQSHDYNLVVSDWVLNPSTGPEWISRADSNITDTNLKKQQTSIRKTPVIFISGSDRIALTRRIRPMDHFIPISFISKTTGASTIGRMIEEFLRHQHDEKIKAGNSQ